MTGTNLPSSSSLVPKPWGYEYCAYDSGSAAVWVLHIARGRKTSRHCHPNKRTQLIVLEGEVSFNGKVMKELESVEIPKGAFHQTAVTWDFETASENGAFLMEIEEPSNKSDLVREADAYGRAGKPIESDVIAYKGELLGLSHKSQSAMGYRFQLEVVLGGPVPDLMVNVGDEILGIYREKKERVSDCVAKFIENLGVDHVFGVVGGGSMHLNDSFRKLFVPMHHEQAASFAADAYSRLKGIGACLVTTGPGGTNAITGLACSWVDSIPVVYISGQVTTSQFMQGTGLRQRGIQETDIVSIVEPITKYAVTLTRAEDIRYVLEEAAWFAHEGRSGPVWIDIPLDLQSKRVDWDKLKPFVPPRIAKRSLSSEIHRVRGLLMSSKRPCLVLGNGIHLSHAESDARALARNLQIPVLTSWTVGDVMADDPHHIGHFGIFGDRPSNLAVQNADLLIVIGCRLSIGQAGYNPDQFARGAKIVMVDVDHAVLSKTDLRVHIGIRADAKEFIKALNKPLSFVNHSDWLMKCLKWKRKYPMTTHGSYGFIQGLSECMAMNAIVVTDMGTSFTCTFQAAKMKFGQRWITASGHAPMGYGLPGAIGAHYATGEPVVCIVGDGAMQFNVQELATVAVGKLPITIHLLDNGGYLTMKHTQANHFGRFVGADRQSGLAFPDWKLLADAYGVKINVIKMDPLQPLIPRVSSVKLPDGSVTSRPLEDMYPFLPRHEFKKQMIVPPLEEI